MVAAMHRAVKRNRVRICLLDSAVTCSIFCGLQVFHACAGYCLYWVPNASHCNVRGSNAAAYWKRLREFLALVERTT